MIKRDIVDLIDDLMEHVSLLTDITDDLEIDDEDTVSEEISESVDHILSSLEERIY